MRTLELHQHHRHLPRSPQHHPHDLFQLGDHNLDANVRQLSNTQHHAHDPLHRYDNYPTHCSEAFIDRQTNHCRIAKVRVDVDDDDDDDDDDDVDVVGDDDVGEETPPLEGAVLPGISRCILPLVL